jgi:altronate dehydratase small subunit
MTTGAILMNSNDNVATSLTDLIAGCRVIIRSKLGHEERIVIAAEDIPFGHKIAIRTIDLGEDIVKYGHRIGEATAPIAAGQHVHVHNLRSIRGRAAVAEAAAE